jgi:hypothetical protein
MAPASAPPAGPVVAAVSLKLRLLLAAARLFLMTCARSALSSGRRSWMDGGQGMAGAQECGVCASGWVQ